MSSLLTSRDTIIQDTQFNNAQTIYNNYNLISTADQNPWEILEKNTVLDALFDSDARFDPPKCHPDTRTAVLDHIERWATEPDSLPIMWIRGAAGAGKSAISQTLSERWDENDTLAASFYFSRTVAGRNEKKYLIATLAHQLLTNFPTIRPFIEGAIKQTPKIFERNLRTQMRQLIINPLIALSKGGLTTIKVVVIDGLDECCIDYPNQDHERQQKEILESIHLALSQKGFPLRFLIASRPERQIRAMFDHGDLASIAARTVLDDTQNPNADIELYLRCRLEEIRKQHPYLGTSWPSKDVIDQLVAKSSGQFIYAAVVVRFLGSPRGNPDNGLKTVMGIAPSTDSDSPFAELDALYTHILDSVAPQSLEMVMNIFGLMIYNRISTCRGNDYELFQDSSKMSPLWISKYLFISLGELHRHLIDLHSLLYIPSVDDAAHSPISFLHASFSEFLTQPSRSAEFHIEEEQKSVYILSLSIRHLFVQVFSPFGGTETRCYRQNGFAFQTNEALTRFKPDSPILEALQALLTRDESKFLLYIQRNSLDGFGTTRQSSAIIRWLYNYRLDHIQTYPAFHYDLDEKPNLPVVLAVLKLFVDPHSYNYRDWYIGNEWPDPAEEIPGPASNGGSSAGRHSPEELSIQDIASGPPTADIPSEPVREAKFTEDELTPQISTEDIISSSIQPTESLPDDEEKSSSKGQMPNTPQLPGIPSNISEPQRHSGFRKRLAGFLTGSSSGRRKH